jgi:peroxin-3
LARSGNGDGGVSDFGSTPPSVTDDDGRSMASMSLQSESGMHISQLGIPTASATTGDGVQNGGQQAAKARKSKLQLWNDLKISGMHS